MATKGRALVLGAGVSGLTTALQLLRQGWKVRLVAERFAPNITSSVAGALWEWPPGVCGKHIDLERSRRWAAASLRAFTELAADPATGVFLRPVNFYFRHALADDPFQREKMAQVAKVARGFRHDAKLLHENGIVGEYRDAYRHIAPMIDTDIYLKWLLNAVREAGGEIITGRVPAPLDATNLLKVHDAETLVNCTGFSSRELASDPALYPLRGAVLRGRNDGRAMPRIEEGHCVSHDGVSDDPGFIFIVPRGADRLLIGGFAEPRVSNLDLSPSDAIIRDVFRRCVTFMPALQHAEIDSREPLRAGLRPAREGGVRLERVGTVIHNYGHGGSGVTYSWGCAEDLLRLME